MNDQDRQAAKLNSIQILRAVAASVVVAGHIIGATARYCAEHECQFQKWPVAVGAGVDLFFVISGFIMVIASERMFATRTAGRDFILRRLVRIVPLYWGVTTVTLVLMVLGDRHVLPGIGAIAASYLFVPFDTTGRNDGFAFPIVDLGWTLNYEMMFYAIFALFIGQGRRNCVAFVTVVLTAIIGLGALFQPSQTILRFWSQPISIEFVAGMWIATLHRHGKARLPGSIRILLAASACAYLALNPIMSLHAPTTPNGFDRVVGWGIPVAILLIAAISGPIPWRSSAERVLVLIGDASYSLYLTHPFWLLFVARGANILPFSISPWVFASISFLGAIAVAVLVHLLAERPITNILVRRLHARSSARNPSMSPA